jgi:hypothetical protein
MTQILGFATGPSYKPLQVLPLRQDPNALRRKKAKKVFTLYQ